MSLAEQQKTVIATDRLVDIVEEGFDAGVRLGESLRSLASPKSLTACVITIARPA